MNIGLVDVDGHNYPNLALMKLSAFYKAQGHSVGWADMFGHYDKVFMSKVFTWTDDDPFWYDADEIERGGTGYKDYTKILPDDIEHMMPDYGLYGIDYAMGFTTRGCIRHCPFCLVHDKEGKLHEHADIREFLGDRKKVVLLDNNIVASRHGIRQLEYCRDNGIAVDCNQGMDARIIWKSAYLCDLIADLPPFGTKGIRIACDVDDEIEPCHRVIQSVLERNPKATFIVYCILTDDYDDSVRRVLEWRKYGHAVAVYAPPIGILRTRVRRFRNGRGICRGGQAVMWRTLPVNGMSIGEGEMSNRKLYLICTADHLETALFCGTSAECMALLGIRSASYFSRAIRKRQKVMGFFRVEKVPGRME